MAEPYVGEIRMFGGNFAPEGWRLCQGQTLPISEHVALFQLIGTTYGGDGQTTFNLPNLAGRLPMHQGTNPGTGTAFVLGQNAGVESVVLTTQQLPNHSHPLLGTSDVATVNAPANNVLGATTGATTLAYGTDNPKLTLAPGSISNVGNSQPHDNMQPYLCVNFIISLFGVFPSQN
jgi:microcystin-dependent protein